MQIKINVHDTEVKEEFKRLQAKLSDMTPAMRDIGEIIRTSIERNFAAQGRPKTWDKSKRGGQTLSDTGRLRRSFTVRAYSDRAEVGTNVKYAAIHQLGGIIRAKDKPYLKFQIGNRWVQKKEVTMPARPFMLIQDEDWGKIRNAILQHLNIGG